MQNFTPEPKQNIGPQSEKADLLKREDIRTMQKDIIKLREIEAQKEGERIAAVKFTEKKTTEQPVVPPPPFQPKPLTQTPHGQEEIKRVVEKVAEQPIVPLPPFQPKPLTQTPQGQRAVEQPGSFGIKPAIQAPVPPKTESSQASLMPRPPKRISQIQKILIRIIIVIFVILILGFFYWYFFVKTVETPEPDQGKTDPEKTDPIIVEEEEKEEPVMPEVKEIVIYPALVKTVATTTLEITSSDELDPLVKSLAKKPFKLGFTRILIENISEKTILSLSDFFQIMGVKTPEGFFEKINPQGTLVVYAAKNQNRLGFITETNDPEGLYEIVSSWEATMENDMETLYSSLGKTGQSSISSFRTTNYKNDYFRYVYFPPANFGICWSISNNYFIWTTSGESMTKAIDALIQ